MKFKVGDKVKVLDDPSGEWRVIEEERKTYGVMQYWTGGDWHEEDDLELVSDPLAKKIEERNNKPEEDLVNHPAHYNQGSMETIEKIKLLLTKEEYRGFLKGNIIKYDDRMNHKGDAERDLRKSKWYAERLRKSYYGGTNPLD